MVAEVVANFQTHKGEESVDPENMVSQAGFEPATFPLGGGCSIQLSY